MISENELTCSGCFGVPIDQKELDQQKASLLQSAYFKDALNSQLIDFSDPPSHDQQQQPSQKQQITPEKLFFKQPVLDLIEKEENEIMLEEQKNFNVSVVSLADDVFEISNNQKPIQVDEAIYSTKQIINSPQLDSQKQSKEIDKEKKSSALLSSENFDMKSSEMCLNKPYVMETHSSTKKSSQVNQAVKNLENIE